MGTAAAVPFLPRFRCRLPREATALIWPANARWRGAGGDMHNEVFYPELQPDRMGEFNQNVYGNLLLAEGDSWFAWGYLNLEAIA
jgi:hypothetical protein